MITYIFLNRIYSLQELAMLLIGDVNLIDDFAILSTDSVRGHVVRISFCASLRWHFGMCYGLYRGTRKI